MFLIHNFLVTQLGIMSGRQVIKRDPHDPNRRNSKNDKHINIRNKSTLNKNSIKTNRAGHDPTNAEADVPGYCCARVYPAGYSHVGVLRGGI